MNFDKDTIIFQFFRFIVIRGINLLLSRMLHIDIVVRQTRNPKISTLQEGQKTVFKETLWQTYEIFWNIFFTVGIDIYTRNLFTSLKNITYVFIELNLNYALNLADYTLSLMRVLLFIVYYKLQLKNYTGTKLNVFPINRYNRTPIVSWSLLSLIFYARWPIVNLKCQLYSNIR